MNLLIKTSPVGAFDIMIADENSNVIHKSQAFYCDIVQHLAELTSRYNIKQAYVIGQKTFVPHIVKELEETFSFPVSSKL